MYLPALFIYNDIDKLEWLPAIEEKYEVTGDGKLYQADISENGNYVTKYLGGIAILQAPFFALGHVVAKFTDYPADGFSPPYQWALAFGAFCYAMLSLFGLRRILLHYFGDKPVAITLLLLFLASNVLQYIAIDSAMSHVYILPLYVLLIYGTMKWHEEPKMIWVAMVGLLMGVAVISRPTEALMVLIPILWNTHSKESKKAKWALVKANMKHVYLAGVFGVIGILPQLIYWKINAGTWIFNVGSKWVFANPWFRVLFGFTNGWFIYTPVAILFIVALFYIKKFPFRYAVITFCILNIWVVIAWFDWRYGATYSTRALCQSYPILALALGALVQRSYKGVMKYVWVLGTLVLIGVNLFQIPQYNSTVLFQRDISAYYYSGVFLDANPTPLDMARLDNSEELGSESGYTKTIISEEYHVKMNANAKEAANLSSQTIPVVPSDSWLKIEAVLQVDSGYHSTFIYAEVYGKDTVKYAKVRLFNPVSVAGEANPYAFYIEAPKELEANKVNVYTSSEGRLVGEAESFKVTRLIEED
jgi:hypothetical protein